MAIRDRPLLWIIALLLLGALGLHQLRLALRSPENVIRGRIESLMDAVEDKQPRRITNGLTDDYADEDTLYSREDVRDAARGLLAPGMRYRATLDPVDGVEFLTSFDDSPEAATIRVHCLMERRASGPGAENAPWQLFWDLSFTADVVLDGGRWRIRRTRDVNHDQRPRR